MGDTDEPTVNERRGSNAPTVDHRRSTPKIADSEPPTSSAFDARDRFETRGELGRGGMGRVDDAFDRALGRQVAIKHVLSQADVDLARFEREARITARLEHPGIVPVHDIGRAPDGTPYYVMRRVDGEPLSELVAGKPLAERLHLVPNMLAACDAAAFAHSRGVVHRDIKPTNILVGTYGETLLIDWGLAREVSAAADTASPHVPEDQKLTRAGTVAGTPGFMSPEQARGETVDARADVFALGATLFFVLAGALPWHGGTTEVVDHVGAGRPPDWRLMPAEVPPDLRAIVDKAMSPDLDVRYADAGALAADLRQFTLGNLVAAYEYGWFAKLVRFVRRHRAAVSIAAASIVALAIVGIVSVRRVLAERDSANTARALAETRQKEARAAADRLLIAHARELVDVDPVEAIAALRTLPPDSPGWAQAWGIASAAFYNGIPIGFVGIDESALPQISADNAHAFVVGFQTGHTIVIDIANRTARDVGTFGRIIHVAWLDNSHIIAVTQREAIVFDIESGQRRSLPELAHASLYTNREGLAMLHAGTNLFELTAAAAPHLIESGIDSYVASPDLRAAVVRRGTRREMWVSGTRIAMPDLLGTDNPYYIVRNELVIAYEVPDIVAWQLVGGKLVQRGRWPQRMLTQTVLYAGGGIWSAGAQGYERIDEPGITVRGEFSMFTQTSRGALAAGSDGSLTIRDDDGTFHLGRRHAAYSRFDQSKDGRFVIATTLTGEVLLWDLSTFRPTELLLASDESPAVLDGDALWVVSVMGFKRIDLATRARTQAFQDSLPMSIFIESFDRRTIAALDYASNQLQVREVGGASYRQAGITAASSDLNGIVFGGENGELAQWQPDAGKIVLAKFDQPVTVCAANGDYAVAAVGERDIVRIAGPTRTQQRAHVNGKIDSVTITKTGDLWFIVDGAAYRWRLSEPGPTPLPTPEPVDGVRQVNDVPVFHSPRSLLVYTSDTPRVIAKASRYVSSLDDGVLVLADVTGEVSLLDIATGSSFELPLHAGTGTVANGGGARVGYVTAFVDRGEKRYSIFGITVPREPAALRRWLTTITNAEPVPNSEAVAWPRASR